MDSAQPETEAASVMAQFESLGDTCELGFVQRHVGIEPISLLRWGGAPLPGLIDALRARFAGLYRREDLVIIDGGSVLDTKYDLRFHAGPYAQDGQSGGHRPLPRTEEVVATHAREARHISFLLRTTLETLANRSRIFVYKTNAGLDPLDILQLKAAIDLYGPQRLLCVLPADDMIAAGQTRLIATGVKIAGITRFAPYEKQDDFDAACWLSFCRDALSTPWGDEIVHGAATGQNADAPASETSQPPPLFEQTERGVIVYNRALAMGLVTAIYNTLLLRPPDGNGLQALTGQLLDGHKGAEDIMEAALESPEFAGLVPRFLARYVRK